MNGNWQEADTRIISFPDDEPDTFALYLNHLYTGQLPIATETDEELKKLTADDFSNFVTKQYHSVLPRFRFGRETSRPFDQKRYDGSCTGHHPN